MHQLKLLVAAAAFVASGAAMAGTTVGPDGDLGVLSPAPAQFGDLLASGLPDGKAFTNDFTFTLDSLSDVRGSVSQFLGEVTFSSITIGGVSVVPTSTTSGYSFEFLGLDAGTYTLTVDGDFANGFNAYTGAIYAASMAPPVPEPGSLALLLAGLGAVGWVARRRAS